MRPLISFGQHQTQLVIPSSGAMYDFSYKFCGQKYRTAPGLSQIWAGQQKKGLLYRTFCYVRPLFVDIKRSRWYYQQQLQLAHPSRGCTCGVYEWKKRKGEEEAEILPLGTPFFLCVDAYFAAGCCSSLPVFFKAAHQLLLLLLSMASAKLLYLSHVWNGCYAQRLRAQLCAAQVSHSTT